MRNDKDDRRVKYTKMVLRESLISLLYKKDISQITIKEICDDADINRATFYAHYSDQYDLFLKIGNEVFENLSTYIAEYTENEVGINPVGITEKIMEYIKENAKLCKLLLSDRGDTKFQKSVMKLVYDKIRSVLTSSEYIIKEEAEYIYSFTITGCIGIVQKWLDEDMKKSARFMSEMLVRLATGITSSYK